MLKKISTKKLVPGMFIANSGIHWMDNPYLYSNDIEATPELIKKILGDGFREVFVDPKRSLPGLITEETLMEEEFGDALIDTADYTPPELSLAAEMPAAQAAYTSAIEQARIFMDGIRRGDNVDLHKTKPLIDSIIDSLARNPDALLGLCKLRDSDDYTYTHCVNVSVLSVMFAKYMSMPANIQHAVGMAGMFHDIGKAMVPNEILNAPRNLSDEEFAILRRHPRMGYEQVKKTPGFTQDILLGIYDHHERFNGTGYPREISGDAISVCGRILAMADVYDALTSRRPYKDAMMPHRVLGIMYQMRGEDFYPGYIEHFIRMLGIYPVGSVVELQDKTIGVVSASNSASPTKPRVLVLLNAKGQQIRPEEKDISRDECPPILRCLTVEESPISPAKALGIAD